MKPSLKKFSMTLMLAAALSLVIFAAGCSALPGNTSQALQASGLIETTEITVAPELSGRVAEVNAKEGEAVQIGAVLFRLDDTLLQAQRQAAAAALTSSQASVQAAQAALGTARAQYDMTLSSALAQVQSNRSELWQQAKPSEFDQPIWYFSKSETIHSTQSAVDTAQAALGEAQSNLSNLENKVGTTQFLEAEERLANARTSFQVAQEVLDQLKGTSSGQELRDSAQNMYDDAKTELDDAQKAYDETLTTEGAQDVLAARARVVVAQERYDTAMDALHALQTGSDSLGVAAAAKAVDQAQAVLEQSQAGVTQAQAELDLIDAQIAKLTTQAPSNGVVLASSIQPGEVLQAGSPAMTLGRLDQLTVTVYIPEDRYGEINLGDQASLAVDSFPGETFAASITHIANQAEFTPQNVQTKEGRQSTVYAVKLAVDNSQGKLKPGMPVDVTFNTGSSGG
jgi:HlyD family secretion protein